MPRVHFSANEIYEKCSTEQEANTQIINKNKAVDYFIVKEVNKSRYIFVDSNRYGIVWLNAISFMFMHIAFFIGIYRLFVFTAYKAWIFGVWISLFSAMGVTVGAHRLWSHKTFKATLPLRIVLMVFQTIAGQNDIYTWCRDHRLHHKFSETDADPHNSKRGFFFCHVGWLLTKKHPDVVLKGKTVDCSDLLADPVVKFQRKYYLPLYIILGVVFPIVACHYLFDCSWIDSFISSYVRYIVSLHTTWFVNSAAHMFGDQPYNPQIAPRENIFVSLVVMGSEGFHNYHHTFPWDYTISETGWKFNPMKHAIELWAKLGLAYDLKRASPELIARVKRNILQQSEDQHPYEKPHDF
ncbi:stearoyl-CoA desaturase-like protein [Leptotrombidium deliense]|uniref:Stearoyl-CoA desaturase-like protein n=1 Tax=Leptotrombidium deliense TaxID=299467 RepID=A0A443S7Y3_9ACAR|nr:stearoyl-CoA desaturase-like protein [Leptotrombidium deliense]